MISKFTFSKIFYKQPSSKVIANIMRQKIYTKFIPVTSRFYQQVKNLEQQAQTIQIEEKQRTSKVLQYTKKVYKPSKTIEFNRQGQVLLFSCDNVKNVSNQFIFNVNYFAQSTIYLKYPYIMYDCLIPLVWYIYFVNPFMWKWQVVSPMFYLVNGFAFMPHVLYWKALERKIHKLYLLRGGKYVRICTQNPMGDRFHSWGSIYQFNVLTSDYQDFEQPVQDADFLTKEGQLKYEVQCQLDNWVEHFVTVQDEIIYFMKEGVVHEPELFEWVLKGYNIDTSDFVINTQHNIRFLEPNLNQ